MNTTNTYTVRGMSCSSCASKVAGAVNRVAGVTDANVDLANRTVTVAGQSVDDIAVRSAITDAGYQVD